MTLVTLLQFSALVFIIVLGTALMLAPLETLRWWARFQPNREPLLTPESQPRSRYDHYVVFLDGIAKASRENYHDVELFLSRLQTTLPNACILGDIVPYSITNRPLTKNRPLATFWRWAKARKTLNYKDWIGFAINVRNLFQVLVSADSRYGPVYNFGAAKQIIKALWHSGYAPGSGVAITLIGYSGGAQIAAGATPFLKEFLRAPIDIISLGGVLSADLGLNDVRFFYHITGSKDNVEKLGYLGFPGRWKLFASSSWNRAKRRNKLAFFKLGPMTHNGDQSYLDVKAFDASGVSHLEVTLKLVTDIILYPHKVKHSTQWSQVSSAHLGVPFLEKELR